MALTTEEKHNTFWNGFIEFCNDHNFNFEINDFESRERFYLTIHLHNSNITLGGVSTVKDDGGVRVEVSINGDDAENVFSLLLRDKTEIEQLLGHDLQWFQESGQTRRRIYKENSSIDIDKGAGTTSDYQWVALIIERFREVFRPRVEAILAKDD